MKWTLACSNKDDDINCLVQITTSNINTENRDSIIDCNNAMYHTDSVKIISIINFKTKERLNTAYYYKNNDIIFEIDKEIIYKNAILENKSTDKGFEYFLIMKRAVNEFSGLGKKTFYFYEGDICFSINKITITNN